MQKILKIFGVIEMPNHVATAEVPALPLLMKNAGIVFAASTIMSLKHKHRNALEQGSIVLPFPSPPTVGKLVSSQPGLVKHDIAKSIVKVLKAEIVLVGGHVCKKCETIFTYDSRIPNLGPFIQHLSSMRAYSRDNVLELLASNASLPLEVIGELAKKNKTAPWHVAEKIKLACHSAFPDVAGRVPGYLEPVTIPAHVCEPIAESCGRGTIRTSFLGECTAAGC